MCFFNHIVVVREAKTRIKNVETNYLPLECEFPLNYLPLNVAELSRSSATPSQRSKLAHWHPVYIQAQGKKERESGRQSVPF